MEEGGEDGAVGAVFGARGPDGNVGFEDGEAGGGGWHRGMGGGMGSVKVEVEILIRG